MGGEGGEVGGGPPGGSGGTCCKESGMSVPAQMAPFRAPCHLVSMSKAPST